MSLDRFVEAQDPIYASVVAELRAGRKRTHCMWFVFPQFTGLGMSATSRHYALTSLEEARQYVAHPVLGPRLEECCSALLALDAGVSAVDVFGSVDAMKLRSSMTLFARASAGSPIFASVLDRFYGGAADARTETLIEHDRRRDSPP